MTTTVTKTIGIGREFSSLTAWADAAPDNLIAVDQIWRGEVYPEGSGPSGEWQLNQSTANLAINGTTDQDRYFLLEPAAGKSFKDKGTGTALNYNPANGVAISVSGGYAWFLAATAAFKLRNLQLNITTDKPLFTGPATHEIRSCLIVHKYNVLGTGGGQYINCAFINTSTGQPIISSKSVTNSFFLGCTFVAPPSAGDLFRFDAYSGNNVLKNCAIFGYTGVGDTATLGYIDKPSSINNAASFGSFGFTSSGNQTGLVAADQLESPVVASADLRVKQGAKLLLAAAADPRSTTDIFGTARSATAPTIGAVETPAATTGKPTITTTTVPDGSMGSAYSTTLAATGATPITWSIASGTLPAGLTLSAAGVLSGTPTAAGTSSFTVRATNSAGSYDQAFALTVASGSTAPVITTTSLPGETIGTYYNKQIEATGTQPINWSLTFGSLPAGLSLSSAGVISGTPTTAGTASFTVRATNSVSYSERALSITITQTAVAPTVTTTTLPNGSTGSAYTKSLEATGTQPFTWAVISGSLPAGLTLSTAGVISGTPTGSGTASFSVRVTNSAGYKNQDLTLTITQSAVAPSITTTGLPDGLSGTWYSQTISASGTAPITFSLTSGSLPSGLSLSSAGLLTGTPSVPGVASFRVRATNSASIDERDFTLTIAAASVRPSIQTKSLYTGKVGSAYATALSATGSAPIVWSRTSGTLPPGLTLNSDGSLSGTPTTVGTYTFGVQASNGSGSDQGSLTLTIDAASTGAPPITVAYAARPATLDGCWATWSEQQQTNLLRTQMDSGAVKVRRRTTGVTRIAEVSVSMQATKYDTFMSWFNVNCQQGVMPTLMCTPQCKDEVWRFIEPPQITWVTKDVFTATCRIERLPGW